MKDYKLLWKEKSEEIELLEREETHAWGIFGIALYVIRMSYVELRPQK